MAHLRRLAILGAAACPLMFVPAVADEIGELLRSWSEPAAQAAAAQGAKSAAPVDAVPAPIPAVPPEKAKVAPQPAAKSGEALPSVKAQGEAKQVPPVKPVTDDGAAQKAKAGAKPEAKPPMPAKQLFGSAKSPAELKSRAIGWYAKGCLAGAEAISIDGPAWQVMRLSRNRMWGHPKMIALVERLGKEAKAANEWPGLLVGDISQPRGGPMLTGHASHQVGLDADIWLTPMPDRRLTKKERENISATSMLADDVVSVNPKVFGDGQVKLIKRAATYSEVERVLVHPAIKKALCEAPGTGSDRGWLSKVRPYFGHYYHFHIRIGCPAGSAGCTAQPPVPGDDGCGKELTDWLKRVAPRPRPPVQEAKPAPKPAKPPRKKPEITLADLPDDCRTVLLAGGNKPPTEPIAVDNSKDAGPAKPEVRASAPAKPEVLPEAAASAGITKQ